VLDSYNFIVFSIKTSTVVMSKNQIVEPCAKKNIADISSKSGTD